MLRSFNMVIAQQHVHVLMHPSDMQLLYIQYSLITLTECNFLSNSFLRFDRFDVVFYFLALFDRLCGVDATSGNSSPSVDVGSVVSARRCCRRKRFLALFDIFGWVAATCSSCSFMSVDFVSARRCCCRKRFLAIFDREKSLDTAEISQQYTLKVQRVHSSKFRVQQIAIDDSRYRQLTSATNTAHRKATIYCTSHLQQKKLLDISR